jgi:YVTN family beta-propeller protein
MRAWLGMLVMAALPAEVAMADVLIVLNKSEHEAALVDPASLAVQAKLPTGRGPHEVAVSPDGRLAFVSNYGVYGVFREGQQQSEPGNTLTVLDLERRVVRDTFDLGTYSRPHGIVVSRDGSRLWVTCEGSKAVLEVEAAGGAILKAWDTAQEVSHMVVATPDERKLYVANIRSGSVTVIERASGAVKSLPTGDGAEGIDVSPDGREVWVTNRGANTISVVSVAHDSVTASFESGGTMPIRAKFTPDGRQVWVSNARSSSVTVFEAARRSLLGTIAVGAVPVGIQMAPDGKRAFVACTNDDVVKEMDVRARKVKRDLKPGREPDGMAWAVARAR